MNTFNYQQKIAIMRILLDIIQADGRIDAREMFYFNQLKEKFQMQDDSRKDVDDKNSLMALAQVKMFDEEQKEYFADLMANMIVVDENIDANEVMIYDIVRNFAGIKKDFDRTI
ncbi:MAG: hypothetical protein NC206_00435 [Bacteroides sp.]|nr:hypothetical protein [Roseburia sp.]MCM1345542.1 hypothetical protein [Bacteroides sp.]MCM1420373.1 hypothetical protein [Bacteroides sp.]